MKNTELIDAVKSDSFADVVRLLDMGADVNEKGSEQEWSALNFAAGKGNLEIVKLLVSRGANPFQTGRDKRTPYKIAIAASRVAVAKYLMEAEEKAGGDVNAISSREGDNRPYCKAYYLKDLRKYANWTESKINWKEMDAVDEKEKALLAEIAFIHQDFTVTQSIWHGECVLFEKVEEEWKRFCLNTLQFKVPTDFDLIPSDQGQVA